MVRDDFLFVATSVINAERVKLGYVANDVPIYVCLAYQNQQMRQKALQAIFEADVVIAGAAPEEFIKKRLRMGKLVLRYSERPFKKEPSFLRRLYYKWYFHQRDLKNKNVYMLCASAYAADDFASIDMYKNRMYKWGYFPMVIQHNIDKLISSKKKTVILWCGRFIDWKHPDDAILLAAKLKKYGCDFLLNMIGTGDMDEELRRMAKSYGVDDVVHFLGSMPPEQVRSYMEEAGIYLFTSDRQEGWGAVLNEAMASGCAVVASDAAGATPFLIRDGYNGMIYQSENEEMLLEKVQQLLCQPTMQMQYGKMAYRTIMDTWNGKVASKRLVQLMDVIMHEKNHVQLFEDGPCSSAYIKMETMYNV